MVNYAQTLFPAPNVVGSALNGLDTTKSITRQDEGSGRLDHQFTEHDNIWARYTSFRQPVSGSGGFAGLLHEQVSNGYNLAVDYTHLFPGSTLAEFHFGRTSVNINQGSTFAKAGPAFGAHVGFSPTFPGGSRNRIPTIPQPLTPASFRNPHPTTPPPPPL